MNVHHMPVTIPTRLAMSKRFKGHLCAYCSIRPAVTGDHIFARSFFVESARADLPQAPICTNCNNEKSKLEHYLAAVLPFGGRHPDALENLVSMVPKRLRKNVALHRQLAGHSEENVPIEGHLLEKLFVLIARGLAWYHWKIYLNDGQHSIRAAVLTPVGTQVFKHWLAGQNGRNCVNESLGNGTFRYEAKQGMDDPTLTIWCFSIYGGLLFSEDGGPKPVAGSEIIAITGPHAVIQGLNQTLDTRKPLH